MPQVQKTNKKRLYHIASYNKRQHVPIPLNPSNTDISFPLRRNSFFRLPLKREARIIVQLQPRHRLAPRNTKGPPQSSEVWRAVQLPAKGPCIYRGGVVLGSACSSSKTCPAGSALSGMNMKGLMSCSHWPTHVRKHMIPVIWGWSPWPPSGRCPHFFHFICLCCLEHCEVSFCLISPWQEFWENSANIDESQTQGDKKSCSKKQNPQTKRIF